MKTNNLISRAIKKIRKIFQPKEEKSIIEHPKMIVEIPKHETKVYHNPPCFGIAKDAGKKRRAKRRMQKRSRITNRKAA